MGYQWGYQWGHGGFHKWEYPNSWMVCFMENLIKTDDVWVYEHTFVIYTGAVQVYYSFTHIRAVTNHLKQSHVRVSIAMGIPQRFMDGL